MSTLPSESSRFPKPGSYSFNAGFLSYLVPGLGQMSQGRIGKGLLFFFCLNSLFLFGMYLGDWKNVHLPDVAKNRKPWNLIANIYNRPQFAGQFWMGIVVWPAMWQCNKLPVPSFETSPFWHNFERTPPEYRDQAPPDWSGKTVNELIADGDKTWDLGWVYTVIAGVLNLLVIYDAAAGPAFSRFETHSHSPVREAAPA